MVTNKVFVSCFASFIWHEVYSGMHKYDDVIGSKMNKQFETGLSNIFLYLRARESVKLTQLALNWIQQHFLIKNRLVDTILIRELMQSLGV